MCGRSAGSGFDEIVQRVGSARRLLIVTHARPDGDALGTMAALASATRAAGRSARMLLPDDVPERYAFVLGGDRPAGPEGFAELADEADLVVVVDTCAFAQLDGLEADLRARRGKVVVVDHHATTDDVADVRWVDPTAAAAGVMVLELIDALGWPVEAAAAEALFVAMATDTGWFRHANADGRCLRAAARLLETGIATDELYRRLYQSDRPERLRLLTRALASLELHHGGEVALMKLRREDFAETGARADETEDVVNEPLRIGCVAASILVVEAPGAGAPVVRGSLRSRGRVDVSAVARGFGGGGHARAAGLRSDRPIDELADRLVAACVEALGGGGTQPPEPADRESS